jgi:hypothetical protein
MMTDQERINRFVGEIGRVFHAPIKQETTMTTYDNTNRGVLFSERDKKTKDDDRDYAGTINIEGTEYWLSAWIKTSKAGAKYMSLSVKPKEERASSGAGSVKRDMDDYIPFAPEWR